MSEGKEIVMYGRKEGQQDWENEILVTDWQKVTNKEEVLEIIKNDGWIIRFATFVDGEKPDFIGAVTV